MDVRSLGYRTDLALLRLGGSTVEDGTDEGTDEGPVAEDDIAEDGRGHLIVRSPHNPAHWWGNFMLLAEVPDPHSANSWVERFAVAFPQARHLAMGFDAPHGTRAELAWFADHGFDVDVSAVMTATEVHPPRSINAEAICRALESDDDWRQSLALRLRCFPDEARTPNYEEYVRAKIDVDRKLVRTTNGAWFGAFLGDRLVAQLGLMRTDDGAENTPGDGTRQGDRARSGLARFQSVETDPEFRRQGLAGTLAYRAGRFGFEELNARTLVMVADPDYFAIDLYRSMGFEATESQLQVQRAPAAAS